MDITVAKFNQRCAKAEKEVERLAAKIAALSEGQVEALEGDEGFEDKELAALVAENRKLKYRQQILNRKCVEAPL